jgi:hypothetical protein
MHLIVPINLSSCPMILMLCSGSHTHPIPTPTSAPKAELQILSQLLLWTGENLAGMTAQGAQCNIIINRLLCLLLPDISEPGLGDLHVSFYNKSYLGHMIQNVKDEVFPDGNGWNGVFWPINSSHLH